MATSLTLNAATVMRSVNIEFPGHPLMFAYSAVNACIGSSGPVVEAVLQTTIPHSIIEQLRMLQCFLEPKQVGNVAIA